MKRTLKIIFAILAAAMVFAAFAVCAFAEDEPTVEGENLPEQSAELVPDAIYEIIAANGMRRSSGTTVNELKYDVDNHCDGDTVVLLAEVMMSLTVPDENGNPTLDINGNPIYNSYNLVLNRTDRARTLNFDLNGYGMRLHANATFFSVSGENEINVYSSRPGAYLYSCTLVFPEGYEDKYNIGGAIFSASGSPKIRIGRFEKADGTVAPGCNISTTSAALINFTSAGPDADFLADGGTYYRFDAGGWVGFLIQRASSAGTIRVQNANLILNGQGNFIYLDGATSTVRLDNCLLYHMTVASKTKSLCANFNGTLILKDCVSSYDFNAPTTTMDASNTQIMASGKLYLEGENVFRNSAVVGNFAASLESLKDGMYIDGETIPIFKGFNEDGYVLARVSRQFEIEGNPIGIIPGSDDVGFPKGNVKFVPVSINTIDLEGWAYIPVEETVNCRFVMGDGSAFTYPWKKAENIMPPMGSSFPKDAINGVFRYQWKTTVVDESNLRMEVVPYADFDLLISYDLYSEFNLNIYVPKDVFNVYVDPVNCFINGQPIIAGSGKEVTVDKDGESVVYYCFSLSGLAPQELLNAVSVSIPLSFWSDELGRRIIGDGSWTVDVLSYYDKVCAEGSGVTDAERQMMNDLLYYVKTAYQNSFADEGEADADLLAALDARIGEASLTANGSEIKDLLSASGAGALDASLFGSVEVDKALGKIKMILREDFNGEIRVYLNGKTVKYAVEGGKVGGSSEVILRIPAVDLFDSVIFKVLDAEGNLLGAGDSPYSGYLFMIDGNQPEGSDAVAYYAFAYAVSLAYGK